MNVIAKKNVVLAASLELIPGPICTLLKSFRQDGNKG